MSIKKDNSLIIKKVAGVGSFIILSRISGFLRDIVLASLFGTSPLVEAFVIAQRLPYVWRNIIGEGAVNSSIVPVLSRYALQKHNLWKIFTSFFLIINSAVFVFCIIASIFAPYLVKIAAPGFIKEADIFNLCVRLSRITFFYLFFITLYTSFMGLLFSMKIFSSSFLSPLVGNIFFIIGIYLSYKIKNYTPQILALSFVFSASVHLIPQIFSLKKIGFKFIFERFLYSEIKEIFRLLFQRSMIFSVYYINIFIDTIFASLYWLTGKGAVSGLYYASRVIFLPISLIGISFSSVLVPFFSGYHRNNDRKSIQDTLIFSLRNTGFISVAISIWLSIYSLPLVQILFQRGHFNIESVNITSYILSFYSLGLIFFIGNNILSSYFFSQKRLNIPFRVALWALVVNLMFNVLLIFPLRIGGVALATSLTGLFRFLFYTNIIAKERIHFQKFFKDLIFFVMSGVISVMISLRIFDSLVNLNLILRLFVSSAIFYFIYGILNIIFKKVPFLKYGYTE